MQYRKSVFILSGICIFLTLTLVLGIVVQSVQWGGGPKVDFVAGLTKDSIASITMTHGSDSVKLAKTAEGWTLGFAGSTVKAKDSRVEGLIATILTLKSTRLAASTAASHEQLKVTDALADKLELADAAGTVKKTLLFGDQDARGSEQFIRESGVDSVYSTAAGMGFNLLQKEAYWADLSVWPATLKAENVIAISYDSPETGNASILKTTQDGVDQWSVQGRSTIDQQQLSALTHTIVTMEGESIIPLKDGIPSEYGGATVRISLKDSTSEYSLEFHKPKTTGNSWLAISKDRPAKTASGDNIGILVPEWKVKADLLRK